LEFLTYLNQFKTFEGSIISLSSKFSIRVLAAFSAFSSSYTGDYPFENTRRDFFLLLPPGSTANKYESISPF